MSIKRYSNLANVPAAIGPYCQVAAVSSNMTTYYLSGQLGLDPVTGNLAAGFEAQVIQAMKNVEAALKGLNLSFADVVQARVYLTDLTKFPIFNKIYEELLGGSFPARATVGVAALPKGGEFEIEMIAVGA